MASKAKSDKTDTPAMRQFKRFKEQHPDCVLFFRMGDFYEMFHDDAKLAHKVLGVTLTQRTEGVPMAGVPYHSVEGYLRRMIQAGYRVAVCDQVQDPKEAKGVVDRDVTRVVTPGTLTDDNLLEEGASCPLAAVMFLGGDKSGSDDGVEQAALAWAELSTGDFRIAVFDVADLVDEIARIGPSELLYVETANVEPPARVRRLITATGAVGTARPGWQFRQGEAIDTLKRQFGVAQLGGFGLDEDDPALGPAGAIVAYLLETQKLGSDVHEDPLSGRRAGSRVQSDDAKRARAEQRLKHLRPPRPFRREEHLVIDQTSLRSLEIERTVRSQSLEGSLLSIFATGQSRPVTAMGKRLLRQWLCYPLCERAEIETRQRTVEALVNDSRFCDELRAALDDVQDVQRIAARMAVGRATPRDLVALGASSTQAKTLTALLGDRPSVSAYHDRLAEVSEVLATLGEAINEACVEAPPAHLREGGLIRDGYDAELDEARGLQRDSNTWLAQYQKQLIESTGIPSLKVGYNKVFGYYIEVTMAHRDKVRDNEEPFTAWTRKQTLKNAERFITPELKEYESKVLSAEQRAVSREQDLFSQLCDKAGEQLPALHTFAEIVAELDVMGCFATRAVRHGYVKPELVAEPVLSIEAGRHPVLDETLGDRFVPNDVGLGSGGEETKTRRDKEMKSGESGGGASSSASLAIITGPNMAGKSTYIRMTALITLLAHTGSFVPAERAVVGMCDRIFTRIGASDELHADQSTFMVEMTETANICHHATERSLIILDEIGRGTSTLDGLSLAWAITEHLARKGSRTLFATHYHEITSLAEQFDNVTNLNVTVREWKDEVVFLHRIAAGSTDRSYGIHVAKIAGLPRPVVDRANELLGQLQVSHESMPKRDTGRRARPASKPEPQMSLFTEYVDHPVVDELRGLDLQSMSPMEAFDLLRALRARVAEGDASVS